jgi:hypothetical protein
MIFFIVLQQLNIWLYLPKTQQQNKKIPLEEEKIPFQTSSIVIFQAMMNAKMNPINAFKTSIRDSIPKVEAFL